MADIDRTQTKYMYNLSVTRYTFTWYRKIVHVLRLCPADVGHGMFDINLLEYNKGFHRFLIWQSEMYLNNHKNKYVEKAQVFILGIIYQIAIWQIISST